LSTDNNGAYATESQQQNSQQSGQTQQQTTGSSNSGQTSQSGTGQSWREYQQRYSQTQRTQTGSSRNKSKASRDEAAGHWLLIILALVAAWPIGAVLMVLEIMGKWPSYRSTENLAEKLGLTEKNYVRPQSAGQHQTQNQSQTQTQRPQQAQKTASSSEKKDEAAKYGLGHVRLFRILGWSFTGVFGFSFLMTLIEQIENFYSWGWLLQSTLPVLALTLIGVTFLGVSKIREKKYKRFLKYKKMIGKKTRISVASLSKAIGRSRTQTWDDLEEMLERNFFEKGYLDASRQLLILEDEIDETPEEETEEQAEQRKMTAQEETLQHIRRLNETIKNPDLKDQITHIEELTSKIFKLAEERPEKAGELRNFTNYYLPETLNILENYARLEAQGVEGKNIAEAKQEIEGVMSKLVSGYEKQLDKLFADDVVDISADINVMKRMMDQDGLADGDKLKL